MNESRRQEKRVATVLDGKPTAASGAFWTRKGDVRTPRFLIEAKTTAKKSYSLTTAVWEKIRKEALMDGRIPLMAISIGNRNLVVISEEDFLELCHTDSDPDMGEGQVRGIR